MQNIVNNLIRYMAFGTAIDLLKNNSQIDEEKKLRIGKLEEMFADLAKGIDSMIKKESPYYLVEDLFDILELQGYHLGNKPFNYQASEAKQAMNEFTEYGQLFHKLGENPEEILSNKSNKNKLLEVCAGLQSLYCFKPFPDTP